MGMGMRMGMMSMLEGMRRVETVFLVLARVFVFGNVSGYRRLKFKV